MLLSGLPEITVSDWQENTEYTGGYDKDNLTVKVCMMKADSVSFVMAPYTLLLLMFFE